MYKGDDNDDNVHDDYGGDECSDIHRIPLHAEHTSTSIKWTGTRRI
jgi:hypothetical protein